MSGRSCFDDACADWGRGLGCMVIRLGWNFGVKRDLQNRSWLA